MKRIHTKPGDIFMAQSDTGKKYFQYVANDLSQLNSDVIRAFSTLYSAEAMPVPEEIVQDTVDFYAHCVIRWGLQQGFWVKTGTINESGEVPCLFRTSTDYGKNVAISSHWSIWKLNEEPCVISRLTGPERLAEIGMVINAESIVYRMFNGKYNFAYPGFL